MMKVLIRNIMSVTLAVILLVTTSGFTVFEHQCNTERTTEYSIIIPIFDCDHYENQHHSDIPSCCTEAAPQSSKSCEADNCCDTDSHIVKLNITLDIQDLNKKISNDMVFLPLNFELVMESELAEVSYIIISNDLPPPLSGKDLLIYLNQLNIPYPSV